jgi:AcrR family transcriptional regulator
MSQKISPDQKHAYMAVEKPDPRTERTRRQIVEALLSLMEKQSYQKIKISDITGMADIARQTFYLHFKRKDDVLLDYIDEVFDDFYQDIAVHIKASPDPDPVISTLLFEQWKNHARFSKLALAADIQHLVIKRFQNYISRTIGLYVRCHIKTPSDPDELAYVIDYLAGASWMILRRWVDSDFSYPLEKLSSLYSELNRPGLLSVLQRQIRV